MIDSIEFLMFWLLTISSKDSFQSTALTAKLYFALHYMNCSIYTLMD